MSVGDNLKSARIVDCNGNLQTYSDDDPEVMNAVKVTVTITILLDLMSLIKTMCAKKEMHLKFAKHLSIDAL